jgi:hypothetical protein
MLIGVTGYAQSGKDTAAQVMRDEYGFRIVSWADALRRDIAVLDPIIAPNGTRLSDVGYMSYEQLKRDFPEYRRLLQVYGTDVHRTIDSDYWLKRTMQSIEEGENVVIPDVRFPNEAQVVDHLLLVSRKGVGPVNDHPSDQGLAFPYADAEVYNNWTLERFHEDVRKFMERVLS